MVTLLARLQMHFVPSFTLLLCTGKFLLHFGMKPCVFCEPPVNACHSSMLNIMTDPLSMHGPFGLLRGRCTPVLPLQKLPPGGCSGAGP